MDILISPCQTIRVPLGTAIRTWERHSIFKTLSFLRWWLGTTTAHRSSSLELLRRVWEPAQTAVPRHSQVFGMLILPPPITAGRAGSRWTQPGMVRTGERRGGEECRS